MENVRISKNKTRDTATIASVGMLAYRIFPATKSVNIQLLSGAQEECTVPFRDGEIFRLRDVELRLAIID